MRDAAHVCGIRLRSDGGKKWAVRGGRDGLFMPAGLDAAKQLLIAEGVTDAAAALDLGFNNVVGRPSCSGGTRLVVKLIQARKPTEVVIVGDGDKPGLRGANALAAVVIAYVPVRVIQPPVRVNDIRAWLQSGAKRADVESLIAGAELRRLKLRVAS